MTPAEVATAEAAPVLVTGSHRSGTTWVGRTLAAGGELAYLDEPFGLHHRPGVLATSFDWWFPYVTDGGPQLTADVERMLAFDYRTGRELRSVRSLRDAGRMARDAARFRRYRREHLRPLLKDPVALLAAPWLAGRFGMRVVVLIRHPAAFASSLKRMAWTHPFDHFLHQPQLMDGPLAGYRPQVERFAAHEQDVVDQAALLWTMLHDVIDGYRSAFPDWEYVRHEDLSAEPEERFRALFDTLGLAYSRAARDYVATTTAGAAVEPADGQAHLLTRDSRANVRSWESRLTPDEIGRVRAATADVADRFYDEASW
jgi:hypothetical protein